MFMTIMAEQQQLQHHPEHEPTIASSHHHYLLASHASSAAAGAAPILASRTDDDQNDDDFSDSPTCVIDGTTKQVQVRLDQQRRLKADPNLMESLAFPADSSHSHHHNKRQRAAVTFSSMVIEHEPSHVWDLHDMLPMWWTSNDISNFNKTARSLAKSFLKQHPTFTQTFKQVFQDCSSPTKDKDLSSFWDSESIQSLISAPTDIRGLECRVISMIRKYRKVHIQNVLDVQPNEKIIHDSLLRARSLRTSRPSRALARVLARQDSNAIASMIRKELASEESCSNSDDDQLCQKYDDDDDNMSISSSYGEEREEEDVDDLYDSLKLIHQSDAKTNLHF
jgi:hypothetical protein